MSAENVINIILGDLNNDRVQLENELERVVNENTETPKKVLKVKTALKDVAINDIMISKWESYIPESGINKE